MHKILNKRKNVEEDKWNEGSKTTYRDYYWHLADPKVIHPCVTRKGTTIEVSSPRTHMEVVYAKVGLECFRRQNLDKSSEVKRWYHTQKVIRKTNDRSSLKEESNESKFIKLAKRWKRETAVYSFLGKKIFNENYQTIIGMGVTLGEPITKLILQDLEKGPDNWHYALKKITNHNPVAKGDVLNLTKVREAWLNWGKEQDLI